MSEPVVPVKDWREEYGHLKDFIAAHAGIRIEPGLISIPEEDNPEFYRQFGEVLREPFCSDEPYDFGTSDLHERLMELAPLGISKMLHFKPPRETIFISRTIAGHSPDSGSWPGS